MGCKNLLLLAPLVVFCFVFLVVVVCFCFCFLKERKRRGGVTISLCVKQVRPKLKIIVLYITLLNFSQVVFILVIVFDLIFRLLLKSLLKLYAELLHRLPVIVQSDNKMKWNFVPLVKVLCRSLDIAGSPNFKDIPILELTLECLVNVTDRYVLHMNFFLLESIKL